MHAHAPRSTSRTPERATGAPTPTGPPPAAPSGRPCDEFNSFTDMPDHQRRAVPSSAPGTGAPRTGSPATTTGTNRANHRHPHAARLGSRLPQPAVAHLPHRRQAGGPLEAGLLHVHRPGHGPLALHRPPGGAARLALRRRSWPTPACAPAPPGSAGRRAASSGPAAARA